MMIFLYADTLTTTADKRRGEERRAEERREEKSNANGHYDKLYE
jgi:hypothetical protein